MHVTFVGVRNRTKDRQIVTFDGRHTEFGPEELRIMQAEEAQHAVQMQVVRHVKDPDGKLLKSIEGLRLFEIVPLDEALKAGAQIEENPSIVEARRQAEEKARQKKELLAEIMGELKNQGWRPPEAEKELAGSAKGGRK